LSGKDAIVARTMVRGRMPLALSSAQAASTCYRAAVWGDVSSSALATINFGSSKP
jgi:hypothetical protein